MTRKSVARRLLERELRTTLLNLSVDRVLEIGPKKGEYREWFKTKRYETLDIQPRHRPTVVGTAEKLPFVSSTYDLVLLIEVLEHCFSPHEVVCEVHRILKPQGLAIISTRFVHAYHPDPQDYYRFTRDSLARLLRRFSSVSIISLGNKLQAGWVLLTGGRLRRVAWIFDPLVSRLTLGAHPSVNPAGYLVVARR